MPLSEEEQRILHEMERNLYDNDRAFVERVRTEGPGSMASRSLRWSVAVFVAGLAILVLAFRTSLVLGTFGFFVMLFGTLIFERSARQLYGGRRTDPTSSTQPPGVAGSSPTAIGHRLRSRFRRGH